MKKENGQGVFGISIKPIKTEQELEKLLDPNKDAEEKLKFKGFTYIPKLGFYVADEVSMLEKNWYECKRKLKEKKSFMLTPAEFWIYYDYCVRNKLELVENSFKGDKDEWLNAIISNKTDVFINPPIRKDYKTGTIYRDLIPTEDGKFNRKDLHPIIGLPYQNSLRDDGEFQYWQQAGKLVAIRMMWMPSTGTIINLCTSPDFRRADQGVREAKSKS